MSKVINLRQQRKTKKRAEKEKQADQNRKLHGQTKATKKHKEKLEALADKKLDAHKLDKPDSK